MIHPKKIPAMVFADQGGNITDFPSLSMAGMSNRQYRQPELHELIPLPEGSELFVLPQRLPIGCDPDTGEPLLVDENPFNAGEGLQAVAAFMAPAHTVLLNSAYQKESSDAPTLPLFAYCAVGWYDGRFWVTGFRSDQDVRQDCNQYNQKTVTRKTRKKLEKNQGNRLIQHLGKCCLTYGCPAARNYFLDRWEAPLPTSPQCNARCVGCISLQASGCCPSTQDRINFVPSAKEISQMAITHMENAPEPIVSFGQGCEGEPLLQADTIEKAIVRIRKKTSKGTINLNSNSSLPKSVERLAAAGLDSLRVSLNSVQERFYTNYYRPINYCFNDVKQSIKAMKDAGKFVSLNYFILPGVTDSEAEFQALCDLLVQCPVDLIQLRNLNMDPEWYLEVIEFPEGQSAMGILAWQQKLSKKFPNLRFGYFNPFLN